MDISSRRVFIFPYSVAIFTSAFLVFQVQPVIARFILPWYGGTAGVWTTCLLFFQLGLLAGYLYAHALAAHLQLKQQALVHGSLILLSLFLLPITPEMPEFSKSLPQTIEILYLLALSVGFPFIILSASAPLFQHWFVHVHPGKSPFRLYALSNAGSLLALLSYPFLIEPVLKLSTQTLVWSFIYIIFMCFTIWSAWPIINSRLFEGLNQTETEVKNRTSSYKSSEPLKAPGWFDRISWILLAAGGSVVLLAVTNQMCQDVAVIPFLWVVPLSLYLITFIICFERDAWYQRKIWLPFMALTIGLLVYLLNHDYASTEISLVYQIIIYCAALFGCCMVCHGEMVRRRPAAGNLTMFYLYLALGGALGGVFVNLAAPILFDGFWELHGSLVFVALSAIVLIYLDHAGLKVLQRRLILICGCVGLALLIWFLRLHILSQQSLSVLNTRNFFGVLHVYEFERGTKNHIRSLYHGRICHGTQILDKLNRNKPISYYGRNSGISLALNHYPSRRLEDTEKRGMRIGVIGLGIGTIAAFGQPDDYIRFYEINPDVESIARKHFYYLDSCKAEIEVAIGDGRRLLQDELETNGSGQYDVIVVDAFSGDSIPVHLLTLEASDLYWQHLKENGILALNISNLHLDLTDVVRQMAAHAHKEAIFTEDSGFASRFYDSNAWVLITSNKDFLSYTILKAFRTDWRHKLKPVIWTDDFSNLFEVVEW